MSNRSEIVSKIASELGVTKKLGDQVFNTVTAAVTGQLTEKGQAVLPGFGRFKLIDREAREGRNPRTGAAISIPAKKVVKFKTFQS